LTSDEYAAAKIIRVQNEELSNDFDNELNILKKVSKQQENLPDFIGIFGDCDVFNVPRIWFIMELCHLGPITGLLKRIEKKNQLNKSDKEKIIAYSLQALQYLHESGVMHRGKSCLFLFEENICCILKMSKVVIS
jgi:serine/threonine protein kinase